MTPLEAVARPMGSIGYLQMVEQPAREQYRSYPDNPAEQPAPGHYGSYPDETYFETGYPSSSMYAASHNVHPGGHSRNHAAGGREARYMSHAEYDLNLLSLACTTLTALCLETRVPPKATGNRTWDNLRHNSSGSAEPRRADGRPQRAGAFLCRRAEASLRQPPQDSNCWLDKLLLYFRMICCCTKGNKYLYTCQHEKRHVGASAAPLKSSSSAKFYTLLGTFVPNNPSGSDCSLLLTWIFFAAAVERITKRN